MELKRQSLVEVHPKAGSFRVRHARGAGRGALGMARNPRNGGACSDAREDRAELGRRSPSIAGATRAALAAPEAERYRTLDNKTNMLHV